jgi:hypothetical protein
MPSFEFPLQGNHMPYHIAWKSTGCSFPCGECDSETGCRKGSRLWLVNTLLMRLGRGSVEDAPPLPVKWGNHRILLLTVCNQSNLVFLVIANNATVPDSAKALYASVYTCRKCI